MKMIWGSPPHVRGKADTFKINLNALGITPAHAGKRGQSGNCKNADWDHPRMCGEKEKRKENKTTKIGSPPHVRGKD